MQSLAEASQDNDSNHRYRGFRNGLMDFVSGGEFRHTELKAFVSSRQPSIECTSTGRSTG
jgi:hypothetical protein